MIPYENSRKLYEKHPDLTEKDVDNWRECLRQRYSFSIANPVDEGNVQYTLYYQDENGKEYPILNSNTLLSPTFYTTNPIVGDNIEATSEFIDAVGWCFHSMWSFTPETYFRTQFEEDINAFYNEKTRDHETWAILHIITYLFHGDGDLVELIPLARWADSKTEFGCSSLQ